MGNNRPLFNALGAIVGLLIFIYVIMQGINYFQQGVAEFDEMQRQAGQPILLSETLNEEGTAVDASSEITATTATTATAIADTATVTGTAGLTGTNGVTATTAVTTADAVDAGAAITATEGVTTATELTETETADAAATTAVTTTEAVTATTAVTTADESADDAAVITTTEEATATDGVTSTEVATEPITDDAAVTETEATTSTAATETTTDEAAETVSTLVAPVPEDVTPIFVKAACIGCHVIPEIPNAVGAVGPDLSEIGVVGATRIEGYSAEEYIRESILNPNDFIAPECPTGPCLPGLMVQNLDEVLTQQEIDDVVAYLSTLGVAE